MAKRKKTAAQLDADIAAVLNEGVLHPKVRAKARSIASLMADILGDDGWGVIDLKELHKWVDLSRPDREITDELLEQGILPENCVGLSGSKEYVEGLRRIARARGQSEDED